MSLSNIARSVITPVVRVAGTVVVPAVRSTVPVVVRGTVQAAGCVVASAATLTVAAITANTVMRATNLTCHTITRLRHGVAERKANRLAAEAKLEATLTQQYSEMMSATTLGRAARKAYPGASDRDILHSFYCAAEGVSPVPAE